jgi:predicted alpha/beta hydrolase family esterase
MEPAPGLALHTDMPPVLLLPGWLDSGPGHWQSRWERLHGARKLEQADWALPKRGDWMARLESVLRDLDQPAVLVAHSLGCHLVAAWAAHTQRASTVRAALLVAPPDLDLPTLPTPLQPWRRPAGPTGTRPRVFLPFPAVLAYSEDDPYAPVSASLALAQTWGARPWPMGARGHVNAHSGLGDWPEGWACVEQLVRQTTMAADRDT